MIGGRNFYDQLINDLIKQYDEDRKDVIGQAGDYSGRSLLDYVYFKDNYQLIIVNLRKENKKQMLI